MWLFGSQMRGSTASHPTIHTPSYLELLGVSLLDGSFDLLIQEGIIDEWKPVGKAAGGNQMNRSVDPPERLWGL